MHPPSRVISLLSGGLDSTLATLLVTRQGVPVTAVKYLTSFGCDVGEGSSCGFDPGSLAERFGFQLKLCPMGQDFVDLVRNPPHGRGKNMNPCIDCRIIMLRWAKELMPELGAEIIVTGEVLGQRPMSQNRRSLDEVEKESGLEGRLLRPLSARLLTPTIAETEGWIDRSRLMDFSGRSRKPQLRLAAEFGLTEKDFGQPAGGCLLTDPGFSSRLKDLWDFDPEAGDRDIQLLKVGRHFRVDADVKIVVGRNESENGVIESLSGNGDVLIQPKDVPGPTVLLRAKAPGAYVAIAAALTRRYSDGKAGGPVLIRRGPEEQEQEQDVKDDEVRAVMDRVTHIL
jgi:tRNA U34 2-thiouridine synthase MnmA/TrmU